MEFQSRSGKYRLPARISFSDYQDAQGTLWPASVRVAVEGGPGATYLFKQVRLNAPVTDADFSASTK